MEEHEENDTIAHKTCTKVISDDRSAFILCPAPPGQCYSTPSIERNQKVEVIYIPIHLTWENLKIADEIFWDASNKDHSDMKFVALGLLSDLLGPKLEIYSSIAIEGIAFL